MISSFRVFVLLFFSLLLRAGWCQRVLVQESATHYCFGVQLGGRVNKESLQIYWNDFSNSLVFVGSFLSNDGQTRVYFEESTALSIELDAKLATARWLDDGKTIGILVPKRRMHGTVAIAARAASTSPAVSVAAVSSTKPILSIENDETPSPNHAAWSHFLKLDWAKAIVPPLLSPR